MTFSKSQTMWVVLLVVLIALAILIFVYWQGGIGHSRFERGHTRDYPGSRALTAELSVLTPSGILTMCDDFTRNWLPIAGR